MTPKEWTDKTIADLEKRKRLKEQGRREAESFSIEMSIKMWKRHRCAKGRGRML